MVNCTADQNVIVQAQDAHAWAEYYDSELGVWRVLEATPAEELEDETTVPSTSEQPTEGDPDSPTTTPMPTDSDAGQTATEPHTQDKPQTPGVLPGETPGASGIKEPFRLPDWIWTLFRILLVSACIPLQSSIRKRWKAKKWNQGHHNTMTLNRWRQIKQIARLLHTPIPEELDHLAQKAKFSQHTLTPEELETRRVYLTESQTQLQERAWYMQLIYR